MKKIGRHTYKIESDCFVLGRYSLVGKKEKNGPFGRYMKNVVEDDRMGEETFEKGEREMLSQINEGAIKNAKLSIFFTFQNLLS